MAKPLSLFLDTAEDANATRSALAQIVGHGLRADLLDVGVIYRTRLLDIDLALFEDHGLEDDSGIAFSKYRHQVVLVPFEVGLRASEFEAMYEHLALFLAGRLSHSLGCRVIVVANLQRQLATFTSPKPRLG